jgi:simple sugar transport system permease protein
MMAAARGVTRHPAFTSLVTVALLVILMAAGGLASPRFLSVQVIGNL